MKGSRLAADVRLAEIYTDSEDACNVGTALYEDENFILFHTIDEQAREDGFSLIRKSQITSLQYDTEYLQKLVLYQEFWKKHPSEDILTKLPIDLKKSLLPQLLEYAAKHKEAVSLSGRGEIFSELDTGYIKSYENGTVCLEFIEVSTAECCETIEFSVDDIALLEVESVDNRLLAYANQHLSGGGNKA